MGLDGASSSGRGPEKLPEVGEAAGAEELTACSARLESGAEGPAVPAAPPPLEDMNEL